MSSAPEPVGTLAVALAHAARLLEKSPKLAAEQVVADSGGAAEIKIEVEEAALPDSSLLVQANYEGRTATRKFALRKAD